MSEPIYNTIGTGYNTTRRADPYLAGRLFELIKGKPDGLFLDIGCGTGNYLVALEEKGMHFYGVDPSEKMLRVARTKSNKATFIQGKAEALPMVDDFFDGVMGNFTLHHWDDIQRGLQELYRVLKPGSNLVFLSFTPQQLLNYWLCHYFPKMMQLSSQVIPEWDVMETMLKNAGFQNISTEKYFVHYDLQDHFLYSNKRRPERYLDPAVRNGASSFTAFSTPEELETGLIALEADIQSGKINEVIQQYSDELGDYLFIKAMKK